MEWVADGDGTYLWMEAGKCPLLGRTSPLRVEAAEGQTLGAKLPGSGQESGIERVGPHSLCAYK